MPKNKKDKPLYWSKNTDEAGIRFRIYERPGSSSLWFSMVKDGRKLRRSLGTSSRSIAEENARAICREIAKADLTGVEPNTATLSQVFALYRAHKLPGLAPSWHKSAETRMEVFLEAWGEDMLVDDVSQTYVDSYSRRRMAGTLGPAHNQARNGVGRGTLNCEFKWLASALNFACGFKHNGKRFLQDNPLRDVTWPKEKNVKRPVASHSRFTDTLRHADAVDPTGGLRCALSIAAYTGRRISAILKLKARDVLRDTDTIRGELAALGFDEDRADHMPHGALAWREENDKMGFSAIAPLGEAARAALDTYMSETPRVGGAWLFPATMDDSRPLRREVAGRWLLEAEKLAGLPKLKGGVWHPYRRAWASSRKHLPDVDVSQAGGWRSVHAMRESYQQADAATQLQVVEAVG